MQTIYRDIVSALIFSRDGKILIGKKNPKSGGVYSDAWHIPGGGVDEGEDKLTALKREILEEVGIDIFSYKITLIDDTETGESEKTLKNTGEKVLCKMKFYVYKVEMDRDSNEIETKLSDDLVKIVWVSLKGLKDYKLTPPSITLFTKLGYL